MPPTRAVLALLAAAGPCLAGCPAGPDAPGPGDPAAHAPDAHAPAVRNLVVISIDTLRADRLGAYGYARPTSPAIDRFLAGATLFEDASATSPWTKPSHASLFTGLYPSHNGAVAFENPLAADVPHLASWLAEHGFQTAAVVSNAVLTMQGLERGFAHFEYVPPRADPGPSHVTGRVRAWLRGRDRGRPFFLFAHYNDLHAPYRALPRYERQFVAPYTGRATGEMPQLFAHAMGLVHLDEHDAHHLGELYDAALRQLDDELGDLLDALASEEFARDTLVVFLSDHGEEFLEHGGLQHGLAQYQESVRIPLAFRGPGVPAGRRLRDPVSLVDVLPTALALLGVPPPPRVDGVRLDGLWSGAAGLAPRELVLEADCSPPTLTTRVLELGSDRAIRSGNWKLVLDLERGTRALYDLSRDPGERTDLGAAEPATADGLERDLRAFLERAAHDLPTQALTEEELERLRGLGYAGEAGEPRAR